MKENLIFLIAALLATYLLEAKTKTERIVYPIAIPVVILFFYVTIVSNSFAQSFLVGKAIGRAIIPAVLSGILLFFELKKRNLNNNMVKFPFILIALIVLSLIGFIMISNGVTLI